jgi:hypothetical protein
MKQQVGESAFQETVEQLRKSWGDNSKKQFVFPVFLKLGRIQK